MIQNPLLFVILIIVFIQKSNSIVNTHADTEDSNVVALRGANQALSEKHGTKKPHSVPTKLPNSFPTKKPRSSTSKMPYYTSASKVPTFVPSTMTPSFFIPSNDV